MSSRPDGPGAALDIEALFSVRGKVVLITGGSSGIGRMLAAGYTAAGARVYISARTVDRCEAVAKELSSAGPGTCIALPADLSRPDGPDDLARELAGREPALHVLVNNAGVTWGAPLESYPAEAFDRCWNVNVKALFTLTRLLLPQLRTAARPTEPARVINVGSAHGVMVPAAFDPTVRIPEENYAYSASKAGVHMLTRHLAHRLAADHITVNAMAPGPFDSRMMAHVLDEEHSRGLVIQSIPLGRVGKATDAAGAALFLSSAAGAYVTGAVVPIDGGLSTHG